MPEIPDTMRVVIDDATCAGHGRCYRLAPAVIEADEEGRGRVKLGVVGPEQAGALERAVELCPEQAIRVEPAPGS